MCEALWACNLHGKALYKTCIYYTYTVDGGWGDIGDWEPCSVSCGTGTISRIRLCNNPSLENGGDECVGENTITEDCVMDDCPGKP